MGISKQSRRGGVSPSFIIRVQPLVPVQTLPHSRPTVPLAGDSQPRLPCVPRASCYPILRNNAFCWYLFLNNDIIFLCPPLVWYFEYFACFIIQDGNDYFVILSLFFLRLVHFPWKISLFARLRLFTIRRFYKFFIPLYSLSPLCYKGFSCLCACSIVLIAFSALSRYSSLMFVCK